MTDTIKKLKGDVLFEITLIEEVVECLREIKKGLPVSAGFRQRPAADEFLRSQMRKHFGEAESFEGTTGFSLWGSIHRECF